jgi:hypothetical protein
MWGGSGARCSAVLQTAIRMFRANPSSASIISNVYSGFGRNFSSRECFKTNILALNVPRLVHTATSNTQQLSSSRTAAFQSLTTQCRHFFAGTSPKKSRSAAATAGTGENAQSSTESKGEVELVAEEQETRGGERIMGWWLIGVSLCVAGMVHLGVRLPHLKGLSSCLCCICMA